MSASADVLAQAKVEIDLAAIPEGKNVCYFLSAHRCSAMVTDLLRTGNHQMARQARLHPPPHGRRNQRSRRHKVGVTTRPATRLRPRQEARMAHNAGYAFPSSPCHPHDRRTQHGQANLPSPSHQGYARTSAASPLANPATSAAGSAPATARTTTSPGARGRAPRR